MHHARIAAAALALATLLTAACADEMTWRFNTDGDFEGWEPSNFRTVEVADGMLRGVTEYDCMLISPELDIPASEFPIVEFRVSSTITGGGEVFWMHADDTFAPERKKRHQVFASDRPRVYRSRVGDVETWDGIIRRIRLDILNPAGAEIALDYIRLTSEPSGIVANSGFEDDLDDDGTPDGWRIDAAQFEWSAENVAQGDRSLMIAARPPERSASARARLQIDRTGTYSLDVAVTRVEGNARDLAANLRFFDVFDRPVANGSVTVTRTEMDDAGLMHLRGDFEVPRLAAFAELELHVAPNARVWFDAVELVHVAEVPDPCERPMETWRARWIWAEETIGQEEAGAWLLRSFELPVQPEQLRSAAAQVTADDRYTLWLNGSEVASSQDEDGWRTPETVDLQPHLVRGKNVIAIEAHDVTGAEGVLFEAGLLWDRGSMEIFSDENWLAVGEPPEEHWQEPGFDATGWPQAVVVGEAGDDPWGYLPYEYMGPREAVELLEVTLPTQVAGGSELRVSATIDELPAAAADSPLRLVLLQDGEEVLCRWWPVSQATTELEEGVRLGPVRVPISRFMPTGTYDVALGFPLTQYTRPPGDEEEAWGFEGAVIGRLKVRPPKVGEHRPKATIEQHTGLPTLFLDGRPDPFMHYQELEVSAERIRNMASAGVHIYFLRADDIGWKGPGSYDYTAWDEKVVRLLTHDPQALIIPAFTISGRHQQWWLELHPEELARTEDGGTDVVIYHDPGRVISLASKLWREESGRAFELFIAHCRSAPYASRIIGYLPASGVSWEWQHWASVGNYEPTDYSEPMVQAFRAWLRERYPDEEALREAWGMPEVGFETAAIPSVEQRDGADHMLFRDPRTYRYVIDFYLFYQDVMAEGILHYFEIIKRVSNGEALAGTYYGYVVTMLGSARRAGDSGHMALSEVMRSDLCDFLISPWDYSSREVGEPTTVMSAIGSVLANGKLWAMETDLRTHLVEDERQRAYGAPDHITGTIAQHRRAFASAATKGAAVRWYDFSNGWISGDPRQAQVIGQLRELADRWIGWDRSPDPDGIAVVVDEDTPAAYLSHHIEAMQWLVFRQKGAFERVGAPWNIYLLDDIVAGRAPKFRAYFFLNCFHMTDEERRYINEELKSDGRTLVWFYAPGYIAEDLDVSRISALTGMQFDEIARMREWNIALVKDHPWAQAPAQAESRQPGIEIGPVFVPRDADLEVVGRWVDGGEPGLAVRRFEDWTSVYSAGPILSPALLKRICADAGVPIRVADSEPSYVSRNLIGLHSAVPRTETLIFERPTRVIDMVTSEILAAAATELEVQVDGPATRLLRTLPAY